MAGYVEMDTNVKAFTSLYARGNHTETLFKYLVYSKRLYHPIASYL